MPFVLPEYRITLDYMYEQLPMFQRIGAAAFKKDLGNTLALCAALGQPQRAFPSVHIAGTNGKGSVTHALAAVLQQQGLKVGIYTSPHYKDFRERIKIGRKYIAQQAVVDFVNTHRELIEHIRPSFFEITVAMAFDWFAKNKVDIAVIETGMGGRLDSTNVIRPLLSVITNISFDHEQFLGNSLPAIAGEKAGIIKSRVPVVIGESHPETTPVFRGKAEAEQAPIYFADKHYRVECLDRNFEGGVYRVWKNETLLYDELEFSLPGPFQAANLVTVLQAIDLLKEILPKKKKWSAASIQRGLLNIPHQTNMIGRWQQLGSEPLILADSAHNEAGIRIAMEELQRLGKRHIHCVLGFVDDKPIDKVLKLLPKDATYYFTRADIPRAMDPIKLLVRAREYNLKGRRYKNPKHALRAAINYAQPDDLIFVGGSIFVVGEVL